MIIPKATQALGRLKGTLLAEGYWQDVLEDFDIIEKELKALKIIVKKANIRLFEKNGRYYFKTTNNLYEISKEKYDLLKEILL